LKNSVCKPPKEYLTRWRMLLAEDRLRNSGDSVSAVALSLGCESESAFGAAFKRVAGHSPRPYCRDEMLDAHSGSETVRAN
jgi:AraC-like DNA-binding protein